MRTRYAIAFLAAFLALTTGCQRQCCGFGSGFRRPLMRMPRRACREPATCCQPAACCEPEACCGYGGPPVTVGPPPLAHP